MIRPSIEALKVESQEISFFTPPVQKENHFSFISILRNSCMYFHVVKKYNSYLMKSKSNYHLIIREIFNVYLSRKRYLDYKRKVGVIHEISLKHLRSWQFLIDQDFDYLLVFESDSEIKDLKKLSTTLVSGINFLDNNVNTLFLLGEGFSFEKLGIENLPILTQEGLHVVDLGITNTLFAYMIHRDAARLIVREINSFPSDIPFISFDWLVNLSFINLKEKNLKFKTLISSNNVVNHGSRLGRNPSWQ